MSRIVRVLLIYYRHKPLDLILNAVFYADSLTDVNKIRSYTCFIYRFYVVYEDFTRW
jgi:hypothetical protein